MRFYHQKATAGRMRKSLDKRRFKCYIIPMKARKNKEGYMGSASREHRVKKGKGSYRRNPKHKVALI